MRKVMVFGTFDGIHEGHRSFLREAKHCGDYLIAVVTQSDVVRRLKGKEPYADVAQRIEMVEKEEDVDEAVAGDEELASWNIAVKYRPEVIALGYDQQALKENLESRRNGFDWQFEIKTIEAYQPDKYHNAVLNG